VIRDLVQLHDRGGVEGGHAVEPLDRRVDGPGPDVDEDVVGGEAQRPAFAQTHLEIPRGCERGFARDQVHPGTLQAPLAAAAEALHDLAFALSDLRHVYGDGAVLYPVVRRAAVEVGDLGAGDHGLGGGAALVYAGAPHVLALDERGLTPGPRQRPGQRAPALAGADHDRVVVLRWYHLKGFLSKPWLWTTQYGSRTSLSRCSVSQVS
jgi:hypothetical protein